jgi:predicted ArsR family transcriptional regulator
LKTLPAQYKIYSEFLEALKSPRTVPELAEICNVTDKTIRNWLEPLREAGEVSTLAQSPIQGKRTHHKYQACEVGTPDVVAATPYRAKLIDKQLKGFAK